MPKVSKPLQLICYPFLGLYKLVEIKQAQPTLGASQLDHLHYYTIWSQIFVVENFRK